MKIFKRLMTGMFIVDLLRFIVDEITGKSYYMNEDGEYDREKRNVVKDNQ